MSGDTVISQEEIADISDEEADKLFENGGVAEEPEQTEEVQEEAQPEEAEEADLEATETEEVAEEPKEEKKVNLGALHEERQKRKELQGKVEAMEKRFAQLVQNLQPKQEPETPQIPSIDDDPVSNFDQRLQQTELLQKQILEGQQQQYVQTQVIGNYKAKAAEFANENKDFGDAYNYLLKGRVNEFKVLGYSEPEALQFVQQEEFQIAQAALQAGANPAERLYLIAKERGYKAQRSDAPAKDLRVIEKGQQKSKPGSGSTPSGELSLEALAEMDDDAFNAEWEKLAKKNGN